MHRSESEAVGLLNSRRDFLKSAGAVAASVGGGALIAACGGTSSSNASTAGAGTPKQGGTLRAGITGGGQTDTLDAQKGVNTIDYARILPLFEPLVAFDLNMKLTNVLAESMEPSKDFKSWTVKLRKGVEFHNGKPLSADDVIYSLNRIIKGQLYGYFAVKLIDAPAMRKVNSLTVELPMKTRHPNLPTYMASLYQNVLIVPSGYNPAHPVGTGPFKYVSFTPGQSSTFVRNPHYWGHAPYLDKLVITNYPDENGQVNALLSQQVDCINALSVASLPRLAQVGARSIVAEAGVFTPITMRVDVAPFKDVRVRQALRLVIDRDAMRKVVFGKYGRIGNDLFAIYDPDYDHSLPQRTQDIEKAKSLLKAAGQENLHVSLVTADTFSGVTSMAQVFAQQASSAGVSVSLNQVTPTVIVGPNYLKWPLSTEDYWFTNPYLAEVAQQMLPGAPYNETHWDDPQYEKLYNEAFTTADATRRRELIHEMQTIEYDSGGIIIPYFVPVIDGLGSKVQGVKPGKYGLSFGNWSFQNMWLS